MVSSKKYTVQICGETYIIVSDESPEQIESSVASLDALMRDITVATTATSVKKAAVLAALKLALEVQAVQSELQQTQLAVQNLIARLELAQ